jgi:predicted PurR-regulated permease PerM
MISNSKVLSSRVRTLAFAWILWPFYGAVLWAIVLATVFAPFQRRLISLMDNLLRPFLVGRDTKMADYLVLISTLGGIAIFGLNGFIIGPVIAAMFIAAWEIFSASRQSTPSDRASE